MLVLVSFISFWFDAEATTARVLIGVTTLLTMTTTISGITSELPSATYTKAIDVWTGVCLFLIVASLLEFASVHYLLLLQKYKSVNEQRLVSEPESQRKSFAFRIPSSLAHKLDFLSRIIFPLAFLAFNILYWSICFASVRQWSDMCAKDCLFLGSIRDAHVKS
ncbi:glutamate-gated chloride channel alpha-like isoform X1 [Paramacrobiotus metropolitanus]|uniref:glutamate-gated chloride channel alpha-like isoform X1 n=1 Tax=Paramacrobiotus metropolitanus TaxID=2943436 RepID=UPI0024456A9D|nr:glutamate-gated chloride channel alpha-like isoform X1 [Paramacrobiotus metropolitanus]